MIEFHTLGALDLLDRTDRHQILSVLAQPKRVGFLAYIAIASPRGMHRRDTLLGIFWPDSSESRARNSLSQALFALRRALGEEPFNINGEAGVGVDPEHLWCDVWEFEKTLADGDKEDALDLYRGSFLEGFFLPGCLEFERWVDSERGRLRDLATGAVLSLSQDMESAGNPVGAVGWLRRAREWAAYDELVLRRQVELLLALGDRSGAVREYESFARRLSVDLGMEPSEEVQRLLDKPTGAPSAWGRSTVSHETPGSALPLIPGPIAENGRRFSWPQTAAIAGLAAIIGVGGAISAPSLWTAITSNTGPRQAETPASQHIAVLPFENLTGDPELDHVGRTASMVLTQALERTGLVTAKNFQNAWISFDYAQTQVEQGETSDLLGVFASEVGAGTILHGAYEFDGGELCFNTCVSDAQSGNLIRQINPICGDRDSPRGVLEALQPRVMGAMAMEFDEALTPYVQQVVHTPTDEAARQFQQGARLYLGETRYAEGRDKFLLAHELDPDFATALIFAGWAQSNYRYDPGGRTLLDSIWGLVFERRSGLTPYESAFASSYEAFLKNDRRGHIAALEEACDIAPGEKACYNLAQAWSIYLNQPSRAVEVFTERLEPEKGWMRGWGAYWNQYIGACLSSGQDSLALELIDQARPHYRNQLNLLRKRAYGLVGLGRVDEVFSILEDSLGSSYGYLMEVGNVLDSHGYDEDAIRAWELAYERSEDRIVESPDNWLVHRNRAWLAYLLGRLDQAEEHWGRAARLLPDDWRSRAALGMIAAKRGNHDEGRRMIAWLDTQEGILAEQPERRWRWPWLDIQGGRRVEKVLLWKAWIAEAMGEKDEAVSYLEEILTHPDIYPFAIEQRYRPFPSLYGYEPYERLYWPDGRTTR
jgi:DNA-binding SARP family transcriptional activator/TolB-like protein